MSDSPAPVRQRVWDDDEILTLLKRAAREIGQPISLPALDEWSARTGRPVPSQRTYSTRFGSWRNACDTAGVTFVDRNGPKSGPAPLDPRVCWAAVRAYLELCDKQGLKPTLDRYELLSREHGWPARNTLTMRLGMPWTQIVTEAPKHRVRVSPTVPDHPRSVVPASAKEMILALNQAYGDGSKRLRSSDYRKWAANNPGAPTLDDVRARFGSWAAACDAAGVVPVRSAWKKDSIIEKLADAYKVLGDPFTGYRYRQFTGTADGMSYPKIDAVVRLIGPWSKACEAIGVKPGRAHYTTDEVTTAVRDARKQIDGRLTMATYRRWHEEQTEQGRDVPTVETVSRRYGRWSKAVAAVS